MKSNPTNGSIQKPPKSEAKPIAKSQLLSMKFGMRNYFSKSPKLTNNRIGSTKNAPQKGKGRKKEDNPSSGSIFSSFPKSGYLSSSAKRQSSAEDGNISTSTSTGTVKRLSDSTPNSHSNSSDSLEINPTFFPNDGSHPPLPPVRNHTASINTRYAELIKEYVDNDSTISSSDIQDDLSSVASDGIHAVFFCTLHIIHKKAILSPRPFVY